MIDFGLSAILKWLNDASPEARLAFVNYLLTGDPENGIPPLIDREDAIKLLEAPE